MATWDQHGSVPQGSELCCGWNFSNKWLDNLDPVSCQRPQRETRAWWGLPSMQAEKGWQEEMGESGQKQQKEPIHAPIMPTTRGKQVWQDLGSRNTTWHGAVPLGTYSSVARVVQGPG